MFAAHYYQKAFSIVELLIASAISLIIILAVLSVYVNTTADSRYLLRHVQFNEEINALIQIMANDLKRAGYWSQASELHPLSENPFTTSSKLADGKNYFPYTINVGQNGQCISFAYDVDDDDGIELNEADLFAYRLKDKQLQALSSANKDTFRKTPCDNGSGQWMSLSDKNFMRIETLNFSMMGSQCLNMRTQSTVQIDINHSHSYACQEIAKQPGDRLMAMRFVTISMTAKLAQKNKAATEELKEKVIQVSIPNHHFYHEPL